MPSLDLTGLLGMGYAGYLILDGVALPLLPGSIAMEDNLQFSNVTVGATPSTAVGAIPYPLRPAIVVQVTVPACARSLDAFNRLHLKWRKEDSKGSSLAATVVFANGTGVSMGEAFPETGSISSTAEGMAEVGFSFRSWDWSDTDGGSEGSRLGSAIDIKHIDLQPIPGWLARVQHSAQPGPCQAWSFSVNQNWQYDWDTRGSNFPNIIFCGPLEAELDYTTLAKTSNRPGTEGSVELIIGGHKVSGREIPEVKIQIPKVVRTSYRAEGVGSDNTPIKWNASWKTWGAAPSFTS